MAKPKGGLGRGLSSLLGGSSGEVTPPPPPAPPENRAHVQQERQKVDDAPLKHSANAQEPSDSVQNDPAHPGEEVYSSKEDSLTIKSVVSRPARLEIPVSHPEDKETASADRDDSRQDFEAPIASIVPNPDQPRTNFKKDELEELAESIRENGLLQPILVRQMGEESYQIIAGERRWQAASLAGLENVPVRLKDVDDDKAIELALIENVQRSNLNPIEEAYGYRRIMERGNMTQSEVAQAVSKGRSTIANALRLLELPEDAQQLLFEEKITAGHARAILSVPTEEGRKKITQKLVEDKLSVRETEAIARLLAGQTHTRMQKRTPTPSSFKKVARALRESLKTNVRVKSVRGKNKIEIEFADEGELQRIFESLAGGGPTDAAQMNRMKE